MANHPLWSDDYWLLLMQLYQKKPVGVKSEYSHPVVELGIELHIPPKTLHEQMRVLEQHNTPSLQRLWDNYADNTRRLTRDARHYPQPLLHPDTKHYGERDPGGARDGKCVGHKARADCQCA